MTRKELKELHSRLYLATCRFAIGNLELAEYSALLRGVEALFSLGAEINKPPSANVEGKTEE